MPVEIMLVIGTVLFVIGCLSAGYVLSSIIVSIFMYRVISSYIEDQLTINEINQLIKERNGKDFYCRVRKE